MRFPGRAARHATAMDYSIGTMVIFSVLVVFLALAFSPGACLFARFMAMFILIGGMLLVGSPIRKGVSA